MDILVRPVEAIVARGDLAHLALTMWALGATVVALALLRALGLANRQLAAAAHEVSEANRHVKDFLRELALQPAKHEGPSMMRDEGESHQMSAWMRRMAVELRRDGALQSLAPALRAYNPDQPRVPAGHPDGGRWTAFGTGRGDAARQSYRRVADVIWVCGPGQGCRLTASSQFGSNINAPADKPSS